MAIDGPGGGGGLFPPTSENPRICKFLKQPKDFRGSTDFSIFGLYRGNFGLFCPRKPGNPPPQPNLAAHVCTLHKYSSVL